MTLGVLWVALTGLCTWTGLAARDPLSNALFGFFGPPITSIGLMPIALGLELSFPPRRAGGFVMTLAALWTMTALALSAWLVLTSRGDGVSFIVVTHAAASALLVWRGAVLRARTDG